MSGTGRANCGQLTLVLPPSRLCSAILDTMDHAVYVQQPPGYGMNAKTPRYNDISEILGTGYGFGLGNPHLAAAAVAAAAMHGYGEHNHMGGFMAGTDLANGGGRFGGISPHPAFGYGASSLPATMAKLNMEVGGGRPGSLSQIYHT